VAQAHRPDREEGDFGDVMIGGVKTLNALMPTLAHNTNRHEHHHESRAWRRRCARPRPFGIFDSLGKSANHFLGPALAA
jgi:hypothetical protein